MNKITIHNANAHSAQEVFDFAAGHLLIQGKRSVNSKGDPAYRGLGGLKCPIGAIVPDEDYSQILENKEFAGTEWARLCGHHAPLLWALQSIHDNKDADVWGFHLGLHAEMNGLTYFPEKIRKDYRALMGLPDPAEK